MTPTASSCLTLSLCAAAAASAQVPTPNPAPRIAPRAEWVVTSGITTPPPANRHWSPSADDGANSMFVFGGRTGTSGTGTKRNDLWEFDASTLTWTEHNPDGATNAPIGRYRNAIAWDSSGDKLVMFGGEDGAGNILGDTWEWTRSSNTWNNVMPAMAPSARRFAAMAHDPVTDGMILFGGLDSSGAVLGDTWLYAGGSWAPVTPTPPAVSPGPRAHHSMMTRTDFGDIFLCAGHDEGASPNRVHYLDAWRWDGGSWIQIVPTTTAVPASMAGNQAVYDPIRRRVVMQGGQGISTNASATGSAYGTLYGGSPSGWTSEFDCVTDEWLIYGGATAGTADPVIGRASRYYPAFLGDKVYLFGGQNPSGTGSPLTAVKEYQANPIAGTSSISPGCVNGAGTLVSLAPATSGDRPWAGRTYTAEVTGLASGSIAAVLLGVTTTSIPLAAVFPAPAGCDLVVNRIGTLGLTRAGGSGTLSLPISAGSTDLIGVPIYLQAVQVEAAGLAITAVSASNTAQLALGAL